MSNLILFTNRSGSTIFCDLLSYAHNTVNLGEGIHSLTRPYNFNTPENKETPLYKIFSLYNMTGSHHNNDTRGSDHIGFFKKKEQRINLLKNAEHQWTVKEQTEKLTIDQEFIDYCCHNNINVYMTHRHDVVSQFISKINARYRLEVAKYGDNQFIYTNNHPHQNYNEMIIQFRWLHMYVNVFLEQLMLWRILYEKYKPYVKLVSYEKHIKPMKLEEFGITDEIVVKYNHEKQHLIPTPFNTERVIVVDDHPAHITGAWEQALYYIKRHQYLVEV